MLILSRRPGERIVIGSQVVVTVLEVIGERVKLGIDAPAEIPVFRSEIISRQQAADPKSSQSLPSESAFHAEFA